MLNGLFTPLFKPLITPIDASPSNTGGVVPWSPLDLGASLLAWWDADRADLIGLSGSQVTSWKDRVFAYDAVQATSALRPTYSASSYNGFPSLTFDGSDDLLVLPSQPFPSGSAGVEVWGGVQQDALVADTTVRAFFAYGSGASVSRRCQRVVLTASNRIAVGTGNGTTSPSISETTQDFTGRHVARCQINPTETIASLDGVASTALSVVPATDTTRVTIGANSGSAAGSNFWSGKIRDVIVTAPLSSEQATNLKDFLNSRRAL